MTGDSEPSQFPRHPPEASLEAAEAATLTELDAATRLLLNTPDFGRAAAIHALRAVTSYFLVRGASGQSLQPLWNIVEALENVVAGNLPEMFDPTALGEDGTFKRKWSRSFASEQTQVVAAALMEALMRRGALKNEAAAKVARAARGWPRVSSGVIGPHTVANWRDERLQGPATDKRRMEFENSVASLVSPPGEDYVEDLLKTGPAWLGGTKGSET